MSSSSEDNMQIIKSAFPDLNREEASNLLVMQGSFFPQKKVKRGEVENKSSSATLDNSATESTLVIFLVIS